MRENISFDVQRMEEVPSFIHLPLLRAHRLTPDLLLDLVESDVAIWNTDLSSKNEEHGEGSVRSKRRKGRRKERKDGRKEGP